MMKKIKTVCFGEVTFDELYAKDVLRYCIPLVDKYNKIDCERCITYTNELQSLMAQDKKEEALKLRKEFHDEN
jgi:hypothetical protein